MKIALVSPYDFAYPGGVVNHISCLERYFTEMGHEVRIIAPASKAVRSFGDRFIRIGTPRPIPGSGSVCRITISLWLSSKIKSVLERENFDICHLHEPLMPMLCTTVLRLAKTPTVGTFHASGGRPWYSIGTPVGKLLLKKWFRKLDCKIAVSPIAMEYVNKHFPDDYHIIPNGIDTKHFYPEVLPMEGFNDGKKNILFVGRMEKRKGLNYLLEAYKLVKREIPDSRLIVVGPGNRLRHKYEKQIKHIGLEDVNFIGYSSYRDLPRYYKAADVVCAPATGWESFGIVLLEAMAVGKPLVASNIDGYSSVATDGVEGLLVPPKSPQGIAGALLSVMKDSSMQQQMGSRGRLKALEYDWEQVAKRVLDCYLAVLNGPSHKDTTVDMETIPVK
ncbi:glycosyltransferase family 4 protein [Chloroflexota bacterium]